MKKIFYLLVMVTLGGAVWRGSGMADNNAIRVGFGGSPIPALGHAIVMLQGLSSMLGYAPAQPPPEAPAAVDPRIVRQAMVPAVSGPSGQSYTPAVAGAPPAGNGTDRGPDLSRIPPDLLKMLPAGLVTTNAQGKPELTPAGRVALQQVAGVGQSGTPNGNGQLQAVAKAIRGQ